MIWQNTDFFKFSLDSILLAEFVNKRRFKAPIVDLCAGNMAIPLIISKYSNEQMVGFEIQKDVYDLGVKSIKENKLLNQLNVINDDVKNLGNYYMSESINVMICNPPFFKVGDDRVINDVVQKKIARHEVTIDLEHIFYLAKKYLVAKGFLYLVHRAERLDEIITLGYNNQVYVKEIQLISTKKGEKPRIVLVKCVKNANPGVKINCELCVENVKTYQNIFKEEV